jgi:hypothetical protein
MQDASRRPDDETAFHHGMIFAEIGAFAVRRHEHSFVFPARNVPGRPASIGCCCGMRRNIAIDEHERIAGFDFDRGRRKRKMLNYNVDGLRLCCDAREPKTGASVAIARAVAATPRMGSAMPIKRAAIT